MEIVALKGVGPVYLLDSRPAFPPPECANEAGLVALGGDLSVPRLLAAYRRGIFPWYEVDEPILWWSPDPRTILEPAALRVSRSLRQVLRRGTYEIKFDTAFAQVIHACASTPRRDQEGTWISPAIEAAYGALHELGVCHSAEAWYQGELAGGLYGLCLGQCFFGESMFSRRTDASKVALVGLVERLKAIDVTLIDCQVASEHLFSLGATEIPRAEFLARLEAALRFPRAYGIWK